MKDLFQKEDFCYNVQVVMEGWLKLKVEKEVIILLLMRDDGEWRIICLILYLGNVEEEE